MRILDIQKPEEARGIDRRTFTQIGVGAGLATLAGAGVWSWRRGVFAEDEGRAFDPWTTWNAGENPQRLVSAAILAASKHNTQPWEFRIEPSYIDVFVKPERNVGALDPYRQEADLSAGCTLANLLLAASAEGYSTSTQLLPDKDLDTWVAKVLLSPGPVSKSAMYAAIPNRHTNRGSYDRTRPLPLSAFDAMTRLAAAEGIGVAWLARDDERARFSDLTIDATEAILADAEQAADGARWYRTRWSDVQESADGMTLDASGMSRPRRLLDKLFVAPGARDFDDHWRERTKSVDLSTAPVFGILTVQDGSDRAQWIRSGLTWQRMHLWATANGIAMQPLTQTLERKSRERALGAAPKFDVALRELTGGREAAFAFRAGFPTSDAVASPRLSADRVTFKSVLFSRAADKA
ncbi:MAG TPA: hypothetical protein VIL97_00460 [Thermoanaerobaculia bacterium]